MHIDISRASFDPTKRFTGVIPLQGRVTIDADVREESQIRQHLMRTVLADLLGPAACPAGAAGFGIDRTSTGGRPDLTVSEGRLYVDGIQVANTASGLTYSGQPDGYVDLAADPLPDDIPGYAVYLRVWERAVTALQDPSIREIALGDPGPDTAARSQLVWQVIAYALEVDPDEAAVRKAFHDYISGIYRPRGELAARAKHPPATDLTPCSVAPESRYRGVENQLYRVEVHTGGIATTDDTPGATFIWSRDNGSVEFAVTHLAGAEVTLADLGRDGKLGLDVGDWVQLVDDASTALTAAEEPPASPTRDLFEVRGIDVEYRIVTLDAAPQGGTGTDSRRHPLLRRWDHRPAPGQTAIPLTEGTWIPLEDGVEVQFSRPHGTDNDAQYRPGDHWLIPARTVPGDVLWPQRDGAALAVPPHGIEYHYALLAFVPNVGGNVLDLRRTFPPLVP